MKNKLLLIFLLFPCAGMSQEEDTLFSENGDTMTVRFFRKNGRPDWEENLVSGKLVSIKLWYTTKSPEGFGYMIMDKTGKKPKVDQVREFYGDSSIRIEGSVIGRKRVGSYKTYYANGQIQCDCHYNMEGQRDSIQNMYYENGNPEFSGNYANGKQEGVQNTYYENGNPEFSANYANGKQEGKSITYYDNGQVSGEIIYKNDAPYEAISVFAKDGRPLEKGSLKEGNGTLNQYDDNGKLLRVEHYKNGNRIKNKKVKT